MFIGRAKELGFTLAAVKALLALQDDPAATRADVRELTDKKAAKVDEQLRQLTEKRRALARLRESCEGDGSARECPVLQAIAGIASPPDGG
ncbi:MAG: MerR family DNA-binding protein [Gemmataceae bacterium]|nr:MerR family DNA-binding protein [Gemmataceae bacterium]